MNSLESLARAQKGAITRRQALGLGMSSSAIGRRLTSGEWLRVCEGVYRVAVVPASWEQSLWAAVLCLGEDAVVSHRAAAALLKLPGYEPGIIEVTCLDIPRKPRWEGLHIHCTDLMMRPYIMEIDGLPVTFVPRTLMDLGSVERPARVGAALDDALRRGLTSFGELRGFLDEVAVRGRRGVGVLRRLLAERDPSQAPTESVLEEMVLRCLRTAGFPEPVRQLEIFEGSLPIARLDLAYPKSKVAIEADGYQYHSSKEVWEKDRRRDAMLMVRGWRVIHVTWDQIHRRPEEFLRDLRVLLVQDPGRRAS